jgi:AraC family transcriptional regulator, arabinose operon regulatory protein
MPRKKEGFKNQKAIVLPQSIQTEMQNNPLTKLLFVTDIGFYPGAQYHYRERPEGSAQNILIYCTQGKGWVEVGTIYKKVQQNQFFIIPACMPHRYGADNNDPWTIYWLHFTGDISNSFTGKEFTITSFDPVENTRNDRRIRLFEELYQNLSMGYNTENIEYASICLWYLLGSFSYLPQFERIRAIQQNDIVEKSILYMHDHIDSEISLNNLASLCGFSVSHYSMIFKKKTSRSPIEYFNNLKIQRACQMLDFTDSHINEIAMQLHFEDQFYFSRVFKRVMGVSPMEYRKKKKG